MRLRKTSNALTLPRPYCTLWRSGTKFAAHADRCSKCD